MNLSQPMVRCCRKENKQGLLVGTKRLVRTSPPGERQESWFASVCFMLYTLAYARKGHKRLKANNKNACLHFLIGDRRDRRVRNN
jgi:hypothetical protein